MTAAHGKANGEESNSNIPAVVPAKAQFLTEERKDGLKRVGLGIGKFAGAMVLSVLAGMAAGVALNAAQKKSAEMDAMDEQNARNAAL
jgi:hypothetical protein